MSRPDFPNMEKEILAFWEKNHIFEKSLKKDAPKGSFVFYEGPPTANGHPGIHHVEARAFKDCIPRFRTMQGYHVDRKGGWDTHGLPVELQVEKELGFTGKKDIEEYGVKAFNEKCKENVWRYLDEWVTFTKRLGYWVDLDHAYITYKPEYVESLWWIIKQIWERGLLYKDYRVTPHCPRCGTSLSSHELADGYKEVEDVAVFIKFKITEYEDGSVPEEPEYLVAWTTTPWTLPSNVALAVGDNIAYTKISYQGQFYWVATNRIKNLFTSGTYEIADELMGREMVGMRYEPLFPFLKEVFLQTDQAGKKAWELFSAKFVSTEEGTGIVHTAVMYGADDFDLGTEKDLLKYHLVGLDGCFTKDAGPFAGKFVKEADKEILEDLQQRNLLFKKEIVKHTYPFCWRCKTPVLYYAKDSWYIKMSALRETLLQENEGVHWEPTHIKNGRFGEWLREVKDWAFSRERYWGTPLPLWVCESCEKVHCIGSFEELRSLAFSDLPKEIDPHRPFIDEIKIHCSACAGICSRIPDVCDVWFDSGSMPLAQWHYPFENKDKIDENKAYPADYISEAVDQTRGWFYTLLAVSVALGKEGCYKNVISLGHVLDAKGKKMSKSLGNIIDPFEMMETYGADAVRWYMYVINQPGESKRFDVKVLDEMIKKVFLILWNVQTFYEMFSVQEHPQTVSSKISEHILDKWILARLHHLIQESTQQLEQYKITEPVRAFAEFINDLSVWYVRRSRDRFKSDNLQDKAVALQTLRECLVTITKLLAPFVPFLAEHLYQWLHGEKESVHLESWPQAQEVFLDDSLLVSMAQARSLVSKMLDARTEAGIPVRQVLSKAIVSLPEGTMDPEIIEVIKDEVNVKDIDVQKGAYAAKLQLELTSELIREGTIREIIRRVNALRKKNSLKIEDTIELFVQTQEAEVQKALQEHKDHLLFSVISNGLRTEGEPPEQSESFRTNDFDMVIGIKKL